LLATQNADKAPKPAAFEQRLVLMDLFAQDLLEGLKSSPESTASTNEEQKDIGVDIAVTKHPYFTDKAKSIEESKAYPTETIQVHLTGFDTLIRILDPKYYPPDRTLRPLEPFLSKHRLRVAYRIDADWGGKKQQDAYLHDLASGKLEEEGGKSHWAEKIELMNARPDGEGVVSSTKVRDSVERGDDEALGRLVTTRVKKWVLQEELYRDK